MKIAIPSDDGILVGTQFRCSRAFYVVTVNAGKITRQELRWNLLSEILTSPHGFYYNLCDCDIILLQEHENGLGEALKAKGKTVSYTCQTLVNQAVKNFLSPLSVHPK
ncbi:MAG TPA: hypothetical protein VMC08_06410 [Bacteroidales bacterium]|nr:hypothetical protein [Bacteroidales bacterium]